MPPLTGFGPELLQTAMGREIASAAWAEREIGPVERWPASLKAIVSMMLACPVPMFLAWGPDLNALYNDAYRPILGWRAATALGRPFREIWGDIWDDIGPMVDSTLAGRARSVTDMKLDLARKGAPEESWWSFSYSPVQDETGATIGLMCVTGETTSRVLVERERDVAEAGLRTLNETLETQVEERSRELLKAEERVRQMQKMEAIRQLTGGVAHDFNNLLTVIRGSVELLRRPDLSADRRSRYLDAVGDTADRAAGLTQQLLAFARRQALKPEIFDIGASLSAVKIILSTLVGSRIELEVISPKQQVFALADRGQFDTAIVNMAINARDAMNGTGKLTIAAGPVSGIPAIRSHKPVAGDFLAVTVTDTGTGIRPEEIERIFEPFYTTKAVGAGTGLGLSQVFGFAKQSEGDLRVDSVHGEGATFTLYLPRSHPTEAVADLEGETLSAADEGKGVCVLLVEDNKSVGNFASDALEALGYDCILVADGEAALEELEKSCNRFHVVFSDVVMPGMGGIGLAELVRERHPDVPVILTSGYSHVLAQNGQHGFELLHKPYSIEQLSHVIRKAVVWQAKRRVGA